MPDDNYPRAVASHLAADGWDTSATTVGEDAVVVAGTRGSGADAERLLAMVVPGAEATVTPKHLKYLVQKSRERDVDRRLLSTQGSLPEDVSRIAAEYDVDVVDSDAVTGAVGDAGADQGPDGPPSDGSEAAPSDGPDTAPSDGSDPGGPTADHARSNGPDSGPDPSGGPPPGSGSPAETGQRQPPDPPGPAQREPSDAAGYGGPPDERVDAGGGPQNGGPRQPGQAGPNQPHHGGQRQPSQNQADHPQQGGPRQPQQGGGNAQAGGPQQPPQHAQAGDRPPSRQGASGSLAGGQGGGPPPNGPGGGPPPNGPGGGRGAGGGSDDSLVTTRRAVLFGGLGVLGIGGYALLSSGSDDSGGGETGPGTVTDGVVRTGTRWRTPTAPPGTPTDRPRQVTNRVAVRTSVGRIYEERRIGVVRMTVSLSPGSDPVDLSQAVVQWVGPRGTYNLVHRSQSADAADGHFGTAVVRDPSGSAPTLDSDEDRIVLVLDLGPDHADADDPDPGVTPGTTAFGDQLRPGESASVTIETRTGAQTRARLTVPETLSGQDAVEL